MKRLTCMMLVFLLLCACLPTPETDAVVNRNDEDMDLLISETPAPGSVCIRDAVLALPNGRRTGEHEVTAHLSLAEEADVGGAELIFDADVIVPDFADWPVFEAERDRWSAEERIAMLKAAASDAPIYAPGVYLHADKAYFEQVLKEMADSERIQALDRSRAENGEQTRTESVREYYNAAPKTIEKNPFDESKQTDSEWIGAFYFNSEQNVYVDFSSSETTVTLSVFDRRIDPEDWILQEDPASGLPGRALNNPSLTQDQATERALAFLTRIGFADAAPADAEIKKARRTHAFTLAVESEGYLLVFRKRINGIPGIGPDHPEANQDVAAYAEAWPQERAELYVDGDGIWSFAWSNPTRITKKLTDSAALLDFDAVLRFVKARLRADNGNAAERMIASVCVTRMRLGYCIVPKKDAPDVGFTLPVWIVDYEVAFSDGRTVPYSFSISALNGANLHL